MSFLTLPPEINSAPRRKHGLHELGQRQLGYTKLRHVDSGAQNLGMNDSGFSNVSNDQSGAFN
jgi:hypothetical protein